ncbi:zinc ribbon domain-containing protein [Ferribacterium limneticum]|uniref:zinc ribbon domain-containing protein n=1 Tax=Ferribacterium limneticum TaxID=76259 RepID=UPI001CFA43BF|nr:zinc ribbon domain-containing protein [Ferribacterium limneticum]UCV29359.1 zinc ribbon domain-containing protein [Ferribacterium limneticum]UCV33278.1 zinc ribbon domain-containing protein [Ferribacterium limneticum]
MKCSKCGQEVPADAIYCPHCTGDRKTTDQEVIRGGIRGGAIGLFLGLLPTVWLLFHFGAERGIKAIAFIVPAITFTTGLIIGLVKAKREWK